MYQLGSIRLIAAHARHILSTRQAPFKTGLFVSRFCSRPSYSASLAFTAGWNPRVSAGITTACADLPPWRF